MTHPAPKKSLRDELGGARRATRNSYSPEERKERAAKMANAQSLALGVLKARHEDEYKVLYAQAKGEVGL